MTRGRLRRTKRRATDRRPTSTARGYDSRWRAARLAYLLRPENALCVICKKAGRLTESKVVDHIKPHKGDAGLFWDKDNWQPLCKRCHDSKTAREDGGFGHG